MKEDQEYWSDEELKGAVNEYVKMHKMESKGEKFVKAHIYRSLAEKFDRSPKSFEFRMQNISYVYELLNRSWVTGLKPKRNISPKHAKLIESYIAESENRPFEDLTYFEASVNEELNKKAMVKPEGNQRPSTTNSSSSNFIRDPAVKAWVLLRANGICECCNKSAPFITASGKPYLEVHHLIRLIDNGPDTPENCVAVCPNCHRELHYGSNSKSITEGLIRNIALSNC
ncbi:HNH endonuclease [Vibrio alginolyticus]|nr:HNH endonuclease [Vibrio alginolyticus]